MKDNYDISALKSKKKKVNSRTKGNTFERDISKKLNTRFGTTDFSRSPGSGAFATTHNLPDHLKIYGDLITPLDFRFCIECKKGYNKENLYSLYNHRSEFWKFIDQSQKDADKCRKDPMVIFKQDRQKILAIIPSYIENNISNKISIQKEGNRYDIYLLEELLALDTMMTWFKQPNF